MSPSLQKILVSNFRIQSRTFLRAANQTEWQSSHAPLGFHTTSIGVKGISKSGSCTPHSVTSWDQERRFTEFIDELYLEKDVSAAFTKYVREDYIQHNPFVGSGAQPALQYLAALLPQLEVTFYHTAFDQGIGWIHYRVQGGPLPVETAIVDVYRFNECCVAEHWDVIEPLPANATNPRALF
jgi:predicted SnoaL-like aldol condensation-catalyzing enzyme